MINDQLRSALDDQGLDSNSAKAISTREVEDRDWLAEWKKHWKPTQSGQFIVAPPWEAFEEEGRIVIRIEPNMAFGTGTHETTRLCLKSISELYRPQHSFLDVGTGTGVLAIAAAKMGARSGNSPVKISGYDIDADSVFIARENAALNEVGDRIEYYNEPIDGSINRFDFVCANLTLDAIEPILPILLGKSTATLIMSGILVDQEPLIRNSLGGLGVSRFEVESLGEWIAVAVPRDFS